MDLAAPRKNFLEKLPVNPFVRFRLDGKRWTNFGPIPGGWELRNVEDDDDVRILLDPELVAKSANGDLVREENICSFALVNELAGRRLHLFIHHLFWVLAVDACLEEQLIHKTKGTAFDIVIAQKADWVFASTRSYLQGADFDHGAPLKKRRGGGVNFDIPRGPADLDTNKLIYSARHLQRLYAAWAASGGDLNELIPGYTGHGNGGVKPDESTIKFIHKTIQDYATEIAPSVRGCTEYINAKIVDANRTRGPADQVPKATYYSVRKAIEDTPAFLIAGGRLGAKQMQRIFRHAGKGQQFTRPGQMTYFDCWKVHVETIFNEEARTAFTAEELDTRFMLSIGFDVATGCLVAFNGGATETARLVTGTLRLSQEDKSHIAEAAGCQSSWHMRWALEEAKTDAGGSYRSQLFLGAAMSMVRRFSYAAAGLAWLRAHVERVLRTIDLTFIRRFLTGGTRSNIGEKGTYNPRARAAITIADFMRLLTRFIVDVYHHTPSSRGGLSPFRRAEQMLADRQSQPLPTDDRMRTTFGITYPEVEMNREGLRVENIVYYSRWVDVILQRVGPKKYTVKLDPERLDAISVLVDGRWMTVPGPREFQGITLSEWDEYRATLKRMYGEQKAVDFKTIVAPALLALADATKRARDFFNLKDVEWTAEKRYEYEKALRTFIRYDRAPRGAEPELSGNSRSLGYSGINGEAIPHRRLLAVKDGSAATFSGAAETDVVSQEEQGPVEAPYVSTRRPRRHLAKGDQ